MAVEVDSLRHYFLVSQSYLLSHHLQGWKSLSPGFLSTGFQDVTNLSRITSQSLTLFTGLREEIPNQTEELFFDITVF